MTTSILIAADGGFMRNLFSEMLKADYRIVGEATNGVEAVDLCRELEPAVVLMDVVMPIRDGIEATSQIKEEQLGETVILSGRIGQEPEIKQGLNAGADGYITKPFQKSMVVEVIEAVRAS